MGGPASKPRQLPLELGHVAAASRDDLVVGRSNAAAVELVDRWPDWPGQVVVVAGPAGAGKSHLASIWADRAGAVRLSGAELTAAGTPALGETPVLVDDADTMPIDEQALFHLLNSVRAHDGHLLMTARRFPMAWGVALPDLASRLRTATTVEIHEPDDALLAAVVTKLFADRQVEVEARVVQFIVRRIERSLDTAIALVERLDHAALERRSRITRPLAAETIAAMESGSGSALP